MFEAPARNIAETPDAHGSITDSFLDDYLDTFFIMHFLGDLPPLGINEHHTPHPHVTFLGHALSNSKTKSYSFVKDIENETALVKPFTLKAGEIKFFGISKNIPVVKCENTVESQRLHDNLLKAQETSDLSLAQPYFAGKFFTPHSSLIEGYPVLQGTVNVDSFTVTRHIGGYGSGVVDVMAHFLLTP